MKCELFTFVFYDQMKQFILCSAFCSLQFHDMFNHKTPFFICSYYLHSCMHVNYIRSLRSNAILIHIITFESGKNLRDDTLSTKIHLFYSVQERARPIIITFYYLTWKNTIKGHCPLMLNVFSGCKTLYRKSPKDIPSFVSAAYIQQVQVTHQMQELRHLFGAGRAGNKHLTQREAAVRNSEAVQRPL